LLAGKPAPDSILPDRIRHLRGYIGCLARLPAVLGCRRKRDFRRIFSRLAACPPLKNEWLIRLTACPPPISGGFHPLDGLSAVGASDAEPVSSLSVYRIGDPGRNEKTEIRNISICISI